jgi:hypothetical protein
MDHPTTAPPPARPTSVGITVQHLDADDVHALDCSGGAFPDVVSLELGGGTTSLRLVGSLLDLTLVLSAAAGSLAAIKQMREAAR